MAQWQASIAREPPKTKSELRQLLTEAVRNTQSGVVPKPERAPNSKKDQS
jgi:hypothetical protein